jgi:hypothetical protein
MATALAACPLPTYGMPGEVQERLDGPVLPRPAVQRQEHHVHVLHFGRGGERRPGAGAEGGQLRLRGGRGGHAGAQQAPLVAAAQHAARGVHGDHLVARLAQRLHHLRAAGHRHVALRAGPAEEDGYSHLDRSCGRRKTAIVAAPRDARGVPR